MGFDFVKNNRKELDKRLDDIVDGALSVIGSDAVSDVADITPVKTGILKRSIDFKVSKDEYAVYVGTNVEYAPYVELGTSKQKATNGGKGFLRLGLTLNSEFYKQTLVKMLGEGMND